jgi:hypothetical protein
MCFSAGASFAASGVLAVVGIASVKNAKSNEQIPFAAIPFLFAVQQFAEGALWIGLTDGNSPSQVPIYIFLILAQVVWPAWVPWSVLLLEQNVPRAKIIKAILAIGIAISLYLLYCLLVYKANAEIYAGHIKYDLNFPLAMVKASNILYFIPTVIPLFISGLKKIVLLGIVTLLSFIVTKLYFEAHLISIWCHFAAIISITVWWISTDFRKTTVAIS